jgi:hypothetical protein
MINNDISKLLSVVIICCDDERVLDAIASINPSISIIVSLVPNPLLEKQITKAGATVILSQRGNYSISCNRGLNAVETNFAFIIDSDCIVDSGCLSQITEALKYSPLARAHVRFLENKEVFASKTLSKWYSDVNNRIPIRAYTPGLGMRLNIKPRLGGYFFNEGIFWSGDSEFSYRVQQNGLDVAYCQEAVISHAAISLPHFINSGYKLGKGSHAQVKLGLRTPYENPEWILRRFFYRINPSHWFDGKPKIKRAFHKRLLDAIWLISFYIGYYLVYYKSPEEIF